MAKAKKASVVVRLMSQAGTGYFYTVRRALKGVQEKCARVRLNLTMTSPPTRSQAPTAARHAPAGWS